MITIMIHLWASKTILCLNLPGKMYLAGFFCQIFSLDFLAILLIFMSNDTFVSFSPYPDEKYLNPTVEIGQSNVQLTIELTV